LAKASYIFSVPYSTLDY